MLKKTTTTIVINVSKYEMLGPIDEMTPPRKLTSTKISYKTVVNNACVLVPLIQIYTGIDVLICLPVVFT